MFFSLSQTIGIKIKLKTLFKEEDSYIRCKMNSFFFQIFVGSHLKILTEVFTLGLYIFFKIQTPQVFNIVPTEK